MNENVDTKLDTNELNQLDIENSNPHQETIGDPVNNNEPNEIGFKETIVLKLPNGFELTLGSNTFTTYGLILQAKDLLDYTNKSKETKLSPPGVG